jgi:hypothetical protein
MLQEKIIVTHKENKKMRGYIFSEVFLPMTNTETGTQELVPQLGVLWQNPRTPAVSYHHPSDLIWLELEAVSTDIVEYEDDENDIDDEFETTREASV